MVFYTKDILWLGYRFSSFIAFSARITMSFRIIGTIGVPHSDNLENASTMITWWQDSYSDDNSKSFKQSWGLINTIKTYTSG